MTLMIACLLSGDPRWMVHKVSYKNKQNVNISKFFFIAKKKKRKSFKCNLFTIVFYFIHYGYYNNVLYKIAIIL